MKRFVYDHLVDRENICNLVREQEALKRYVAQGEKVVVYGPRNYGKTSVIKNVVIEDFKKEKRRRFVFFVDLMEVRSMESLVLRLTGAFERSFEESFPIRSLVENTRRFLSLLKPEVSIDTLTGKPSISLGISEKISPQTVVSIFSHIARIALKLPSLVVLDEFQDIARVEDVIGLLRAVFEEMADTPVILMGSKRHILSDIFAKPGAPLAGWGTDLEFYAIPYDDYHAYIVERFQQNALVVSRESTRYLQDSLQRVPEAINRLCQQLMDLHRNKAIDQDDIEFALRKLLDNRESRYESYISTFSAAEEKTLIVLARLGEVKKPQSKSFLAKANLSNRTVAEIFKRLARAGVIEKPGSGYHIADPLFAAYLRNYR